MLHGWDGVLGAVLILLPPNVASGVLTKKLYFCLRPHDLLRFHHWQTSCAGLSMGALRTLQDFNQVLVNVGITIN